MAKPDQDANQNPEGGNAKKGGGVDSNMKVIVINLVTTILICVLFLSVNYVLQSSLLNNKMAQLSQPAKDESEDVSEAEDEIQKGIIVDLGDFVLNLSDVGTRRYLKVNVSLEVSNSQKDLEAAAEPAKEGGHGGHGESAAPAANPVETEMAAYKAALRDAVLTVLSSKTSVELSTVAGKELAKEQITEAVNGIFAGERDVIRVSFGQFIIQ